MKTIATYGIALEAAHEQKLQSFLCSPHPQVFAADESLVLFQNLLDGTLCRESRSWESIEGSRMEWCTSR